MTVGFSVVTRFHPDTLQVPGDPDRLRRGADSLQELATELTDIGSRLRDADAPQETRGPTVRAMSRVAGTLGKVLQADADQLSDLAELTRHQSERLAEAQELVEESRRRWRDARQELRAQITDLNEMAARAERERVQERERRQERARREGKDDRPEHDRDDRPDPEPPTEASQLIRAVDQQVLDRFEGPLRRLAGLEFTERNGASAMLTNGKVEQAAERYRQVVQSIIEELVESLRRINRLDEQLVEQLPRQPKTLLSATSTQGQQPADTTRISLPDDITTVGEELQDCARALREAGERLPDIRVTLREGRMTPDDERQGSMNGFQRTWTQHLDEVREDLVHARRASADIARQLRELDERGAREVRRAFRAD